MNMLKKNINIFWLLFLFILTGVSSCQTDKKFNRIFFGGQIINPSASFVTLYKDNKTIDCLSLNKNYRFFKYYDSLEVGIYKLEHIPEYKSVFLETELDTLAPSTSACDFTSARLVLSNEPVKTIV